MTLKVTAGDMNDFIRIDGPSSATVIERHQGWSGSLEPRKTDYRPNPRHRSWAERSRPLTLKESFKGAFMMDNRLTVEFSGIPEGSHAGQPM